MTPLRLLLVEDSEDDALLLFRELERGGLDVTSERVDTQEAMGAALEAREWDLVISDYRMPQFSGPAALALLRGMGRDLPFIIVSGTIGEELAVEAMKAGAHDYIMKDNLRRLVPAIEREVRDAGIRRERRGAEEALAHSATRWQDTFDAIGDTVAIIDENYRIVQANAAMREAFGSAEVVGRHCYELFHGLSGRPAGCPACTVFSSGKAMRQQLYEKHLGGRWFDVSAYPASYEDGAVKEIVHIARDITERKQAEEALRQSEEQYRALFNGASEGILVADIETRKFSYANPAICRMLGYTEEELRRITVSDIHPRESLEHVLSEFEAQARGEKTLAPNLPCLRKDGTTIFADIKTAKVLMDGKEHAVGFFTDVTERKNLEKQLQQSQKLEAVGQLAGGVAHEFNNILMGISGYAQILLAQADAGSEDAADLDRIRVLSERGGSLSKQLLAFSRSEGSERLVLNINPLVKNACKMLRKVLPESISLEVSPDAELGNVQCDPGQLEQVLVNLAVNARDAMPDGGRLTIETDNTVAAPAGLAAPADPGRWVEISATDTGCGMDQATVDRVFEPFFTTKEVGKGTGLGLATVYGIVQQHAGHIAVRSEPGRGSTFTVYLPRVDAAEGKPEKTSEPDASPRGSETILVVEDDDAVRDVLRSFLEGLKYTVIPARNADEAEELLRFGERKPHLLLTDVCMPGRNGDELYRRLTAVHPDLKVVFVSGYFPKSAPWRSKLPPDAILIQKPFNLGDLACTLRQVLDGPRLKLSA